MFFITINANNDYGLILRSTYIAPIWTIASQKVDKNPTHEYYLWALEFKEITQFSTINCYFYIFPTVIFQIFQNRYYLNISRPLLFKYLKTVIFQALEALCQFTIYRIWRNWYKFSTKNHHQIRTNKQFYTSHKVTIEASHNFINLTRSEQKKRKEREMFWATQQNLMFYK